MNSLDLKVIQEYADASGKKIEYRCLDRITFPLTGKKSERICAVEVVECMPEGLEREIFAKEYTLGEKNMNVISEDILKALVKFLSTGESTFGGRIAWKEEVTERLKDERRRMKFY